MAGIITLVTIRQKAGCDAKGEREEKHEKPRFASFIRNNFLEWAFVNKWNVVAFSSLCRKGGQPDIQRRQLDYATVPRLGIERFRQRARPK